MQEKLFHRIILQSSWSNKYIRIQLSFYAQSRTNATIFSILKFSNNNNNNNNNNNKEKQFSVCSTLAEQKKKKILYHDKYNDLYTHPCNTRILFRLYLYESTRYYSSRYYYSYNYSFTKKKKKKKNKGSNYTLTSETYQPTSKRLILRPSSRPNLL